ncbi:hypothetical protein BMB17_005716, partial [Escherichia coli]|nr:hypothetical protein [Escherichia coli]
MMRHILIGGFMLLSAAAAAPALADEACGLCDSEVVMNTATAKCFLDQYATLEQGAGAAVAVDLSGCKGPEVLQRGVVEPLPSAQASIASAPTSEFMLSRAQMSCLRQKLQEPGLVLDPTATIKLDAC